MWNEPLQNTADATSLLSRGRYLLSQQLSYICSGRYSTYKTFLNISLSTEVLRAMISLSQAPCSHPLSHTCSHPEAAHPDRYLICCPPSSFTRAAGGSGPFCCGNEGVALAQGKLSGGKHCFLNPHPDISLLNHRLVTHRLVKASTVQEFSAGWLHWIVKCSSICCATWK